MFTKLMETTVHFPILQHVGCDRVLGSQVKEDVCRVCGGDGSSCYAVKGNFTDPLYGKEDSYEKVVTIPKGAINIYITEKNSSRNYLALQSINGTYYINGALTIDWPRQFKTAGTIFHYKRKNEAETLKAFGPLSEDLNVMVLLQENNGGISYTYYMPENNTEHVVKQEYVWHYSAWTSCSQSCGSGKMLAHIICINIHGTLKKAKQQGGITLLMCMFFVAF